MTGHAEWQDVTGFDDFVSSPSFLTFKSSMLPFMAGPADLQLFESVEEAFNTGTTRPSYLHVTKLYPKAGISDESQANLKVLESRWDELAEQIQSNSSLVATPLSVALCARGIRKQEGVFLGVTGWGDVEVSGGRDFRCAKAISNQALTNDSPSQCV